MSAFTNALLIAIAAIMAPAAGVPSPQADAAKAVRLTGVLVNDAGAPMAKTELNACPQGDPGKPLLMMGWPVVLDGAQVTTDTDGKFAFDFYPEGDRVRLAKTKFATDVKLRICLVPKGKAEYQWIGPWLDLKKLQKGTPIDLGNVKPESPDAK